MFGSQMYVSDVLELIQPQHEPLRLASRKISPQSEEQDFCRPLEQAFGIYELSPSSSLACMSVLARRPDPGGLVAPLGDPISGSAPRAQHWFSGDAVSLSLHQLLQLWALVTAVAPAPLLSPVSAVSPWGCPSLSRAAPCAPHCPRGHGCVSGAVGITTLLPTCPTDVMRTSLVTWMSLAQLSCGHCRQRCVTEG